MSEKYIVSARKYRPATFRSVVGQQNLTATLKGAIASGRLAHAYLFCGPRGVGKTSCARIFARTINCLNPTAEGEACGVCDSCRAIDQGNSFNLVELDAASNNGVDYMRAITEQVNVPPQVGKYRVFIIDEVHMLSSQAFNAFLKTLEEPPSYVIFILATTEKHKVIPTILSRCQIYDFKRITIQDTIDHLAYVAESEGIKADRRALGVIASKADGAMRDALSIFDQVATSSGGNITYEGTIANLNVLDYEYFFKLVDTFVRGDAAEALLLYKEVRDRGFDSLFFINSLAQHIRDLMVAADQRTLPLLEMPEDVGKRLVEQAQSLPLKWYYHAMGLLNDCDLNYRTATNKQFLVELTLIRLSQLKGAASQTRPFEDSDRPALRSITEQQRAAQSAAKPQAEVIGQSDEVRGQSDEVRSESEVRSQSDEVRSEAEVRGQSDEVRGQASVVAVPSHGGSVPGAARRGASTFRLNRPSGYAAASLEKQREEFSDEQFAAAWRDYIAQIPDQHILTSAMRMAKPLRTGAYEFDVAVGHPAQQQAFEGAMAKLLEYLRTRLKNDYITVNISIDTRLNEEPMLAPADFLKKVISDNANLGAMLKSLDIEIG